RDRCVGDDHGGPDVRADLPRHAVEPAERAEHATGLSELLRAGHVAVRTVHVPARRPLRAAEVDRQPGKLYVRWELGAAARTHVRSDRSGPDEGVRELRALL